MSATLLKMGNKILSISRSEKHICYFVRKDNYLVRLPIGTIAITQAVGLFLILTLPWNVQYRKFLPFTFNIFTCFLYIFVLVIALYLQMIFGSSNLIFDLQKYFVGIF